MSAFSTLYLDTYNATFSALSIDNDDVKTKHLQVEATHAQRENFRIFTEHSYASTDPSKRALDSCQINSMCI